MVARRRTILLQSAREPAFDGFVVDITQSIEFLFDFVAGFLVWKHTGHATLPSVRNH
jgi:hypothetical protein